MLIKELVDLFPKNQVTAETYYMGKDIEKQIQQQYQFLHMVYEERKQQEVTARIELVRIIRARQKIEALKVHTFQELAQDYLDNDLSVVIFVNYTDTLRLLANKLNTDCLIHGEQTLEERQLNIDNFQENKSRIIICQIQSGSVGISLHDIYGGHPRVSLISPTWSAQDLVQALGRIFRANGKTPCLQRIVFCANTVEEYICGNIQVKIDNYAQLNDGQAESNLVEGIKNI